MGFRFSSPPYLMIDLFWSARWIATIFGQFFWTQGGIQGCSIQGIRQVMVIATEGKTNTYFRPSLLVLNRDPRLLSRQFNLHDIRETKKRLICGILSFIEVCTRRQFHPKIEHFRDVSIFLDSSVQDTVVQRWSVMRRNEFNQDILIITSANPQKSGKNSSKLIELSKSLSFKFRNDFWLLN